jgi:hypothetical protein
LKQTTFYILSILLSLSINSFSQEKFERKNLNEKYSWNNSTQDERNEYYFGIKPINLSNFKYHFRYEKSSQIIDLYSENGMDFNGQIINIIQENKTVKTDYGKDSRAFNYLFEKTKIENKKATKAGQLIIKQKSYSTPTDSLINNWNFNWLDCGAITFDYKVNKNYYQKSYTCPQNQKDSLEYVVDIKNLTDSLSQTLDLKKSYEEFTSKLPKGKSYTIDGWINMYIMTEKQNEGWKKTKPIRDYKKSIKDTIDNYLEFKLNELIPNSTELNCYDDYSLTFSKNGTLKNMKVDMGFWERLSDKDYKKCKRVLKKAFREIKVEFVDPKYEFSRELSFGQKGIYIYDRMIY